MQSLRFTVPFAGSSVALALFLCLFQPAAASVGVTINGGAVDIEPAPITQAGRVFVPLRGVFQQLGASVVYDAGHIDATGNGRTISLHIGSTQATVDGQPQTIDVAPFIIGASTYVPLRFISESLGASVDWDDADSIVAITMNGAPQGGQDENIMSENDDYADSAPPPIPDYDQPPVPEQNEIWQPGYWAWGAGGYYWVPGTWVEPPQPGYLWTPGYWQTRDNRYVWNPGYWALAVGFYGGVNYGAGYFGNGYVGGRWSNNTFRYNTSVTHVNTTVVRNVYVDRSVVIVNATTRVSYNGGPHGVQARATAQQLAVAHGHHVGMTPVQQQHVQTAAHDPRLLATVNHNQPPVLAVARPLGTSNRPAGPAPAERPAVAAPAEHPRAAIPAYHAAPVAAPAYHAAPAERPAPAAAPAAPMERAAPPVRPAPAYHREAAQPAARAPASPVVHAAPAAVAPAEHAPRAGVPPAAHRPARKDEATKQP